MLLKVQGDNTVCEKMLCIWGKQGLPWSVWVKKVNGNEAFQETLDVEEIVLVPDALRKQQCVETSQVHWHLYFESVKVYLGAKSVFVNL